MIRAATNRARLVVAAEESSAESAEICRIIFADYFCSHTGADRKISEQSDDDFSN
jgi:hypothetical protein